MTPRQIQVAIRDLGTTQRDIAHACGVSNTTISQVIKKRTTSRRIMDHISNLLGKPTQQVFPEYFDLPETEEPEKENALS